MSSLEPIIYGVCAANRSSPSVPDLDDPVGRWWDPRDTFELVTIEPWVGRRVHATQYHGGQHDWGQVTVWETGRGIAHTFKLARDRE